jgi:hypothetical protein
MRGRFISLLVISSLILAASIAMPAQSYQLLGTPDDPAAFPLRYRPPQPVPASPLPSACRRFRMPRA